MDEASSSVVAAEKPRPGLEHLNAVLIARGYIKKPLNFGGSESSSGGTQDGSHAEKLDTIADLLTTILAERDMDLEIKANLSGKVRALEGSLERKGKFLTEEIEKRLEAQRKETAAAVKASSIASELARESSSHRSTKDHLLRLRRDLIAMKQSSTQSKIIHERKSDALRSKLAEVSTQALLAKGCVADVKVIGGAFDSAGSSLQDEDTATPGQLAMDQVRDLERERSLHLDQIIALKQVAVECINALREAGRKLAFHVAYERAEMKDSSKSGKKADEGEDGMPNYHSPWTTTTAFMGELFPPLFFLSSNSSNSDHPAQEALQSALTEVRNQSETLDALRNDRSASLQRLLSKAKQKISEEAWNEANNDPLRRFSDSSNGNSAEASKNIEVLQTRLNRLQDAYDKQARLLEESEEAASAARGLLDMYRERDERTGFYAPATIRVEEQETKPGQKREDSTEDLASERQLVERLRELEAERQRCVSQRKELAAAKQAFEQEKQIFLKQQQQQQIHADQEMADARNVSSSSHTTAKADDLRTSSRSVSRLSNSRRSRSSLKSDQADVSQQDRFSLRVERERDTSQHSAQISMSTDEANGTIIDHGSEHNQEEPAPTKPQVKARVPSAAALAAERAARAAETAAAVLASSRAGGKSSSKRKASEARLDAKEEAASDAKDAKKRRPATTESRPPLSSRAVNESAPRRRRSSARIASLDKAHEAEPATATARKVSATSRSRARNAS